MTYKKITLALLTGSLLCACSVDKDDEITTDHDPGISYKSMSISKVLEYRPAPGQFINATGEEGTTLESANRFAEKRLINNKNGYISLGSFGGYIIAQFPTNIGNKEGYEIAILGNSFEGSSEPGIVWVSADENADGLANDPWYELKGSDYGQATRKYSVTYTRPAQPGAIAWKDSEGKTGTIDYLPDYYSQMYYPAWITENSYTLTGTLLKDKMTLGQDGIWHNGSYGWGYADNNGNDLKDNYNRFDLSNAVDENGKSVSLTYITFIKVQNAVLKGNPVTGDISSEIFEIKSL